MKVIILICIFLSSVSFIGTSSDCESINPSSTSSCTDIKIDSSSTEDYYCCYVKITENTESEERCVKTSGTGVDSGVDSLKKQYKKNIEANEGKTVTVDSYVCESNYLNCLCFCIYLLIILSIVF